MKLYSLQALRFWAAFGVCIYHARQVTEAAGFGSHIPPEIAAAGQAGVDIFFVLSGYIIASTSAGLSPQAFAVKRAQRILPLWWATALPILVIAMGRGVADWRSALATIALWPATDVMRPPVSIGWTLCFEALFYAAATLVIWRRHALWALLGLYFVALLLREGAVLEFVGNPMILEFLAGALLTRAPPIRWPRALIAVGVLVLLFDARWLPEMNVLQLLVGQSAWARVLLFGLPAVAIVWSTKDLKMPDGFLPRLGDASYALYLLHPLLLVPFFVLIRPLSGMPGDLALAAVVSAIVVISWRAHELIERPVLAMLRQPLRRTLVPV